MLAGACWASSPTVALADEPVTPPVALRHDLGVDLAVTGALGATALTTVLVRDEFQPGHCRWCDSSGPGAVDDFFRTALRRPDPMPAKVTSDILSYGLAPVSIAALAVVASVADRRSEGILTDLVLALQGTVAALVVNETLKPLVVRPRPSIHAIADPDARRAALSMPDNLRSFPSGHTNSVFALTAASGVVATLRGYRLAPLVWATGILLGVATGYGRIAADEHYFTDTLAGAAIGVVFGGGVPLLLHRPRRPDSAPTSAALRIVERATITSTLVQGGRIVGVGWAF